MCHVLGGRRSCECNTLDNGKPSVIVGVVFSTEPSDEVHSELIAAARRGGSAGALLADFRHEEALLSFPMPARLPSELSSFGENLRISPIAIPIQCEGVLHYDYPRYRNSSTSARVT